MIYWCVYHFTNAISFRIDESKYFPYWHNIISYFLMSPNKLCKANNIIQIKTFKPFITQVIIILLPLFFNLNSSKNIYLFQKLCYHAYFFVIDLLLMDLLYFIMLRMKELNFMKNFTIWCVSHLIMLMPL